MSVILISSCLDKKRDLYLDSFPDNFKIFILENGKEIYQYNVDKTHQLHGFLLSWLKQNQKDWTLDFTTYAPSLLINSENLKVNVLFNDNLVVINYKNKKGKWLQVSKNIEETQIKIINDKFTVDRLNR